MTNELTQVSANNISAIEQALVLGNLSSLTSEQRIIYVTKLCNMLGLNSLTKPFEYITLNGKLTLYATKGCAEQLRMIHKLSILITSRETIDGAYVVTARAITRDGRSDESTGVVSIIGLKGEALANAFMKCETKAKRRVTLSVLGLNMLDDSEIDSINGSSLSNTANNSVANNLPKLDADLHQSSPSALATENKQIKQKWSPSEKQIARFFSIAKSSGYDSASATNLLQSKYQISSCKDLTRYQYDDICWYMEKNPIHTPQEINKPTINQEPQNTLDSMFNDDLIGL